MQLSGPDDQAAKVLEASHQYETLLAAKGYKLLGVNRTPAMPGTDPGWQHSAVCGALGYRASSAAVYRCLSGHRAP